MKGKIFGALLLTLLLVTLVVSAGCMTITVKGPSRFIDYSYDDGIKKSEQKSVLSSSEEFENTYNDEFFYDDDGNLVKLKQTEYLGSGKNRKFIVWELEWKVLGGEVIPYRALCNGVEYCTIEYDILNSQHKGIITTDIDDHYIRRTFDSAFDEGETWTTYFSLEFYDVPFKVDDKFVEIYEYVHPLAGMRRRNVLTLGNNNIVLKSYVYSYYKLFTGLRKSFRSSIQTMRHDNTSNTRNSFEFTYDYEVVADNVCMTFMKYSSYNSMYNKDRNRTFEAVLNYDNSGRRIEEEWSYSDTTGSTPEGKKTVFKQILTY